MKKFKISTVAAIAVYAMLAAGLSSCGNESVRHTKDEPFVIMSIQKYSDGKVKYSKGKYERPFKEFFAMGKQSIIFDNDLGYSVGDTLSFQPCRQQDISATPLPLHPNATELAQQKFVN